MNLFAEALTVLILNREVKLIRFLEKKRLLVVPRERVTAESGSLFPFNPSSPVSSSSSIQPPEVAACRRERCRHQRGPKSLFPSVLTPVSPALITQNTRRSPGDFHKQPPTTSPTPPR